MVDISVLGDLGSQSQILHFDRSELFQSISHASEECRKVGSIVPTGLAMEK